MSKISLSWIPQVFESYKKEQLSNIESGCFLNSMDEIFEAKIEAADELLQDIKKFIKEANKLQEK